MVVVDIDVYDHNETLCLPCKYVDQNCEEAASGGKRKNRQDSTEVLTKRQFVQTETGSQPMQQDQNYNMFEDLDQIQDFVVMPAQSDSFMCEQPGPSYAPNLYSISGVQPLAENYHTYSTYNHEYLGQAPQAEDQMWTNCVFSAGVGDQNPSESIENDSVANILLTKDIIMSSPDSGFGSTQSPAPDILDESIPDGNDIVIEEMCSQGGFNFDVNKLLSSDFPDEEYGLESELRIESTPLHGPKLTEFFMNTIASDGGSLSPMQTSARSESSPILIPGNRGANRLSRHEPRQFEFRNLIAVISCIFVAVIFRFYLK